MVDIIQKSGTGTRSVQRVPQLPKEVRAAGPTRPDIEYAVHQCTRFQLNPTTIHENAVKHIGCYLLGTKDKGIIFKPDLSSKSELNCYVDADFAGNYTKETGQDPNNVGSRTGCVIQFVGCPILWFSRLQTEILLSTKEAEYIAL